MKIITVDQEFGRGGWELDKRLSDALNIPSLLAAASLYRIR